MVHTAWRAGKSGPSRRRHAWAVSLVQAPASDYAAPIMDIDLRALAPLLLLAAALAVYALVDLVRAPAVRYLPKWAWALICVLSMPLGPLAYLTLGRAPR